MLAVPAPYDFSLSTERYRTFGRDAVNVVEDGALYRVVGGREVRIAPTPGGVELEPSDPRIEEEVAHVLGLPFELDAFRAFAADDPVLAAVERRLRGLRPVLVPDAFEMLVGSVTAQQVSLHAATAIRTRFVERFGARFGRAYAFPMRERVAAAAANELVALGFSRRKAEYVVEIARALPGLGALGSLPDEEVSLRLRRIRGLGEWSADWFLARHLGRPRAWPAGDLGLRKAVAIFYGTDAAADVRAFGERFAPFENLAAHYLLVGLRTL